ncbi:MAG TPA: hypothetical protein VFJ57_06960 [Solirubrobacterales bacterium]|nr:hypothetical protein [Solirubrobacterales bacterium]
MAALVLLLPAGAVAAADAEDESFAGAFVVNASNGYKILGIPFARGNPEHGELALFVGRKGESVIYFTRGKVTPTAVEVDLGSVAKVDFTFVPSGRKKRAHSPCDKKHGVEYEAGNYVGSFEFRGEEGFATASVTRTPVRIEPLLAFGCAGSLRGETWGKGFPGARLRIRQRRGSERLSVQLNKNRPSQRTLFEANLDETRGKVQIHRGVGGLVGASAFSYAPDVRTARTSPPAPFSGTASFDRSASRPWRGNLTVDFPGRSGVPLVTPDAKVSLVHARWDVEVAHHDRPSSLLRASRFAPWLSTKR